MFGKLKKLLRPAAESSKRKGFTLTEAAVSSSLLVVAIVPVFKGLTTAHLTSTIIEQKTKSLMYAQAELDRVTAQSVYNYNSSFDENSKNMGDGYLCNISDTTISSNLRQITVSVGYDTDDDGVLSSSEILVTLSTKIARRW